MKIKTCKKVFLITNLIVVSHLINAQEPKIKELDFLIGTWETRDEIKKDGWWETATRKITYSLKGNYIKIKANSIDSNGREREYLWYINYNKKTEQFEMTSMFSNWYVAQLDILEWDKEQRKLTIRHNPNFKVEGVFSERRGEMIFSMDFKSYVWKGQNKYGDPENPGIFNYVEKGKRIN